MTPEQFCYWLQGTLELGGVTELSRAQVQILKDHLAQVFHKATPTRAPLNVYPRPFDIPPAPPPRFPPIHDPRISEMPVITC